MWAIPGNLRVRILEASVSHFKFTMALALRMLIETTKNIP